MFCLSLQLKPAAMSVVLGLKQRMRELVKKIASLTLPPSTIPLSPSSPPSLLPLISLPPSLIPSQTGREVPPLTEYERAVKVCLGEGNFKVSHTTSPTPTPHHPHPHHITHTHTTSPTPTPHHPHPHHIAHTHTTSPTPTPHRPHPHHITHTHTTSPTPTPHHPHPHHIAHTHTTSPTPHHPHHITHTHILHCYSIDPPVLSKQDNLRKPLSCFLQILRIPSHVRVDDIVRYV